MGIQSNHLPIIFVSAHGDIDMAVQALKDGAFDFLPKPVSAERLLAAIEKACLISCELHESEQREKAARDNFNSLTRSAANLASRARLVSRQFFASFTKMLATEKSQDKGKAGKNPASEFVLLVKLSKKQIFHNRFLDMHTVFSFIPNDRLRTVNHFC